MKGNNELKLNKATVMEALQMWVDKHFTAKPVVTDVVNNGSYEGQWTVSISSDADRPGPQEPPNHPTETREMDDSRRDVPTEESGQ